MYDDQFFDNMAKAYLDQSAWTKLRLDQVKKMVDPGPGDKIIDMGCGMGSISHFCSLSGAEVTGVDLSPVALKKAREIFPDLSIQFYERDVSDLHGIKCESFDKAVTADLVEHIPQPIFEGMVRETFRVLKPGGIFFIYTPNPTHLIERMKAKNFLLKQNPTHIDLKSKDRIVATTEKTGFRTDTVYFTPSFIPLFKWLERILMPFPLIGNLFQYRICVRVVKPG